MPNLTIFQAVLLRAQCGEEAQLRPDAEVRDNDVKGLVKELVLAYLRHQIIADALLRRDGALDAGL